MEVKEEKSAKGVICALRAVIWLCTRVRGGSAVEEELITALK